MATKPMLYKGEEFNPDNYLPGEVQPVVQDPNMSESYVSWMQNPLDYNDLGKLSKNLAEARRALSIVHSQMIEASSKVSKLESDLNALRAATSVNLSGGTVAEREAVITIITQGLMSQLTVWKVALQKVKNESMLIKQDVDILMALANNVRAEAKLAG